MEVVTPSIVEYQSSDINIKSLRVNNDYLITSPEHEMKKLIAKYKIDCYQITKAFRDEAQSKIHLNDFTIIEWYRINVDYHMMINQTIKFLQLVGIEYPIQRLDFKGLILKELGVDIFKDDLSKAAKKYGLHNFSQPNYVLMDFLYSKSLTALPNNTVILITDFPVHLATLSATGNDTMISKRFEIHIDNVEVANGSQELNDKNEYLDRIKSHTPDLIIDKALVAAMPHLPLFSGVAVGFDRLYMVLNGIEDIRLLT